MNDNILNTLENMILENKHNQYLYEYYANNISYLTESEFMDALDSVGAFTEAYFGKSSTLIEIEQVMNSLVELIKKKPFHNYSSHEYTKQLQNLITKQFGFKDTIITWTHTPDTAPFVGTLSGLDNLNPSFNTKYGKESGYYDTKHKHVCVIHCSTALVSAYNVTGPEYTAILLHEIGHNFDKSIYKALTIIFGMLKSFVTFGINMPMDGSRPQPSVHVNPIGGASSTAQATLMSLTPVKRAYGTITKFVDTIIYGNPILRNYFKIMMAFSSKLSRFVTSIFAPIGLITTVPASIILSPITHLMTTTTRKSEEFADSFATAYGYGTELASGLSKLQTHGFLKNIDKNPKGISKVFLDLTMAYLELTESFMVPTHGTSATRAQSMIDGLKRDLSSEDIDPEVKRYIEAEIAGLEEALKMQITVSSNPDTHLPITLGVRRLIYNIFDGRTDFIAKLFPSIKMKEDVE